MAMRRTLALALLWGLALLAIRATPAHAQEQVTLQFTNSAADPQTRAINAWIDQASTSANHTTDVDLHVGTGGTGFTLHNRRAIVQFDISRIPRAGIKAASLQMILDTVPQSFGAPISRNWEVHQVTSFIGYKVAPDITWNSRTSQYAWTAAGGDFNGTVVASTATGTTAGMTLTWNVLSAVQTYFGVKVGPNAGPPDPNFGFILKDQREDLDALGTTLVEGTLASNSNATLAHVPALVVNVIQQVHGLTATPGSNSVTLNWTYPAQITGSTIVNATTGVVIVRSTNRPVPATALIVDGTAPPALCGTVNASTAILVANLGTGTPTTFTDSGGACAPANGNTYFYKVFAVTNPGGTGNYNYSTNGTGPVGGTLVDNDFVSEIAATPGATAAAQQAPKWIAPVDTATLSAPSIDPGNYAIIATNNNLVQGFNPTTGDDAIAPASVGGTVSSRMPVLEATESDWGTYNNGGTGLPMTFLAASDNEVYDVSLNGSGFVQQLSNPLGVGTPGAYTGGVAMQVKAFSNSGNTKPDDVVIMGTHVAGASPTVNTIFAATSCGFSVTTPTGAGCPGATGGWNTVGGAVTSTGCSTTSSPATCNIDIVTSTPFVDYKRNTVWVTSHNGNAAAGVAASPDVWKLDANSGAVLAAVDVGGDIDSSPTETQDQSVVFVGTNGGVLFAYDPASTDPGPPVTPHQLATITVSPADGAIKGFPLVATNSSPWRVVVSTNTHVQAYDFNGTTFTLAWQNTTLGCNPSTPIAGPNLTDALSNPVVLIGCSDGRLHELLLSTGADETTHQRILDPSGSVIVGDPSLDFVDNEVIVGASDGRVFAFAFPF